jgi:thiol-disulfide isomerase/thioredoxin
MSKKIVILVLTVAAALTAFQLCKTDAPISNKSLSQLVNAENEPVNFESFKGKVVFVNNWATWCPPCVAEMPSIHELKNKLSDADVVFVMVSFDEDTDRAISFMRKKQFDLGVYFPGKEYPYVTSSIPATFILGRDGNIVWQREGMADYSSDEIVSQIKLLAGK